MYWSAFIVSKHTTQLRLPLALPVHDAIAVKQGDTEWARRPISAFFLYQFLDHPSNLYFNSVTY